MPSFQQFAITPQDAANINVPTHEIAGRIIDDNTQEVLGDFTGDNAVHWPSVLSTLTTEQRDLIANQVAQQILYWKAGI